MSRLSSESLVRRLIAVQNLNERKLYNYHFLSCRPFFFSAPRFRRSLFSLLRSKNLFLMKMACFLFKSSLIFLSFSLTHSMSLSWRFRFHSFNVSVSKMCRGGGRRSPSRTVIETWFQVMLEPLMRETWHSMEIKFNFYEWIAFVCRAQSERTIYGLFIPFKGTPTMCR